MSVYMIIQTKEITDYETYKDYVSKARPVIESFGGKYLVSTQDIKMISKNWNPLRIIIIKFPDMETLERCFASEEYNKIVHLRKNSVIGETIAVETL